MKTTLSPVLQHYAATLFIRKCFTIGALAVALSFVAMSLLLPTAQAQVLESSQRVSEQRQYGPTTSQDTLWFLANQFHPDRSVSIYQTMAAIVESNPSLFPEGNIHRLPTGVFVNVPNANQIRAIDAEIARQRMIPLLGGETHILLPVAQAESRADIIEQINDAVKKALTAQQQEHERQLRSVELQMRSAERVTREREERIAQLESEISSLNNRLRSQSVAPAVTANTPQSSAATAASGQPNLAWFLSWPGMLIPIAFMSLILAFLLVALRKPKDEETVVTPHKAAAATHALEVAEESEAAPVAAEAEGQAAANQYRDIADILDEAEIDADADSDIDAGQTPEEAEQAEREALAAQIDLARAYFEMAEYNEALAALADVMPIADNELQEEAERLLAKINQQQAKD